jgi:hypothetical protein
LFNSFEQQFRGCFTKFPRGGINRGQTRKTLRRVRHIVKSHHSKFFTGPQSGMLKSVNDSERDDII